jgi:hypothetical protein
MLQRRAGVLRRRLTAPGNFDLPKSGRSEVTLGVTRP